MRILAILVALALAGCVSTPTPEKKMTAEEVLGSYFLLSAFGGKSDFPDFLTTVYPLRSQIVTYAIIGFHRDRGMWPTNEDELAAYVTGSPGNPPIPAGALIGLVVQKKEDMGITYSTLEDRQRGREFSISGRYRVTFPVPSFVFASSTSTPTSVPKTSTIGFDWGQAIADAIIKVATAGK